MNFIEFVDYLVRRLGHHQVPVRPDARALKELIESSALHYELVKRVLAAVYSANGCRRLTDPIQMNATLDALAPVRAEVLESTRTDVDRYHFMENLCMAAGEAVGVPPGTPIPAAARPAERPKAAVIPIDRFRARRRAHETRRLP